MRQLPGTQNAWDNQLYDDIWNGPRDMYNLPYAGTGDSSEPGYHARTDGNRARVVGYRDTGAWSLARASLQDNFPRNGSGNANLQDWTRTVLMLRPDLVLIHDQTAVSAGSAGDQRMSFNLGGLPQTARGQAGVAAYGVSGAGHKGFAGSVEVVLPAGHTQTVTNVLGSSKAYRLDVHPAGASRRESCSRCSPPPAPGCRRCPLSQAAAERRGA